MKLNNNGLVHGNRGKHRSKEIRRKMSERAKLRIGNKNAFYGKHHSEETKNKIRIKNKGKIPWQKLLGDNHPKVIEYKKRMKEEGGKQNKGKKPWNYGLTKEEDSRVMKYVLALYGNKFGTKNKGKRSPWTTKRNLESNPMLKSEAREKARLKNIGRKPWNKGFGDYISGEKGPNWRGGISFEPYSRDWTKALKRAIRLRDNYTCQLCGKKGINVHHIDYNKKNCNPENLITLCISCHMKTGYNRKKWEKLFQTKKI